MTTKEKIQRLIDADVDRVLKKGGYKNVTAMYYAVQKKTGFRIAKCIDLVKARRKNQ